MSSTDIDSIAETHAEEVAQASFLLRKLLVSYPEFTENHTWAHEDDRWAELIYALLSRVVPEKDCGTRLAVRKLRTLGLLETSTMSNPHRAEQFLMILEEEGFSSEEANQAWSIVKEASAAVQNSFAGNMHFFLRDHAEIMLRQLSENIKFSNLDDAKAEQAFALWLQNSCNLPLSLFDEYVLEFCDRFNIPLAALVSAADNLKLNLAVVDDLIRVHFEASGGQSNG